MSDTSAPVGGHTTTGVFPNRDYETFPDVEQLKREQAREESEWADGTRTTHPSFTRVGPDKADLSEVPSSNRDREQAEADGTY